jgi:hypothetical protein
MVLDQGVEASGLENPPFAVTITGVNSLGESDSIFAKIDKGK